MIWHLPLRFLSPHEYTTAQRVDAAYGVRPSRHSLANHTTRRGTNDDVSTFAASRLSGCSVPTSSARVTPGNLTRCTRTRICICICAYARNIYRS